MRTEFNLRHYQHKPDKRRALQLLCECEANWGLCTVVLGSGGFAKCKPDMMKLFRLSSPLAAFAKRGKSPKNQEAEIH